jgi:two-component system chemotaxis sensor kinase CheA
MTRSNTGILGMDNKVFDTLLEPVFVIDIEKRITYCNEVAAQICDLSVRKLCKGMPIDQAILFLESPHFLPQLAQIADATPYQELSFQSTSGKNGKAQITCQPLGPENWLIFFRDVTLEETLQKKYRAELEQVQHYSKNLEKMVDERTAEIRKLNSTMAALLDSLHQGFFIFDQAGTCLDVSSKACETTIECQPAGKKIWDVLKLEEREHVGFQRWMTTLFAEMLPFEDLSPLGPQKFPHSELKHIKLEYYPIKNN